MNYLVLQSFQNQCGGTEMHTLYKGATIFDVRDGRLIENAALLVKNDVIEAIGEVQEVHCPSKAQVVDLSGKWI
jgi:imidazolonepropionase-like amidohydrolase